MRTSAGGKRRSLVEDRAWEIHSENGHPEGYDGPCWGPLPREWEQARSELDRRTR